MKESTSQLAQFLSQFGPAIGTIDLQGARIDHTDSSTVSGKITGHVIAEVFLTDTAQCAMVISHGVADTDWPEEGFFISACSNSPYECQEELVRHFLELALLFRERSATETVPDLEFHPTQYGNRYEKYFRNVTSGNKLPTRHRGYTFVSPKLTEVELTPSYPIQGTPFRRSFEGNESERL